MKHFKPTPPDKPYQPCEPQEKISRHKHISDTSIEDERFSIVSFQNKLNFPSSDCYFEFEMREGYSRDYPIAAVYQIIEEVNTNVKEHMKQYSLAMEKYKVDLEQYEEKYRQYEIDLATYINKIDQDKLNELEEQKAILETKINKLKHK